MPKLAVIMKSKIHSIKLKLQVIKEATETGDNSLVARRHELNSNNVSRWML